ncbi:putative D,D-dipeptide transport system permease protein DdpC [Candidatus Thermoflexus japonica]|uniref:Putative D,D-dipeptide transport system permease protein DdpC n=1 Tax=Candidatus Thermoflexus japonica TaxID=2035417 RepID=A0A2H5Y9D0_9CHLR|nr:putative D,D-dipeptide transport system permease protein DdpC [Candidatus Thermoflexus japonica]
MRSLVIARNRPSPIEAVLGQRRGWLRDLRRSPTLLIGLLLISLWAMAALLAPLIAPYSPVEQRLSERLSPPSAKHLFGTDELGRDVFSRVLYGARISLPIGLGVVALTALLGTALGAVAGFVGGLVDELIMRFCDAVLAFPSLILAMAITAALGPGLNNAMLAIVLVLWPEYARLMRGQVLYLRELEYVTAARAIGATEMRILWRHILPNAFSVILVKASLDVGNAILLAAALSFVGLGAVPPTPEWGAMVAAARQKFFEWWIGTFPGLAILTVVVGFNFLGDGLRDVLDPRLRHLR